MENKISIGMKDDILFIKAEGEMRAQGCATLNEFLGPYLENTQKKTRIIIDLSLCEYMDSTAIGFILSMQTKCLRHMPESVTVLNPSEKCKHHLKKLHSLDKLRIAVNETPPTIPLFPVETEKRHFGSRSDVEMMFQAHQILSDINEDNKKEFRDLLEELERVLNK